MVSTSSSEPEYSFSAFALSIIRSYCSWFDFVISSRCERRLKNMIRSDFTWSSFEFLNFTIRSTALEFTGRILGYSFLYIAHSCLCISFQFADWHFYCPLEAYSHRLTGYIIYIYNYLEGKLTLSQYLTTLQPEQAHSFMSTFAMMLTPNGRFAKQFEHASFSLSVLSTVENVAGMLNTSLPILIVDVAKRPLPASPAGRGTTEALNSPNDAIID